MADTWALTKLFDAVVTRFAAESLVVPNAFGWREPAKKAVTGKRIVWYPGDPNGDLGELASARYPGRNPRPLATLLELFTVEITSSDASAPETERTQYLAVRSLFDAWYRAVYLAASGTVKVISSEWVIDKNERRHGACIRVIASIEAMIPDAEITASPADTTADITSVALDVSQHVLAP